VFTKDSVPNVVGFRSWPEVFSLGSFETIASFAFRSGLFSRSEPLSRFMHAEGLSWVVPEATSWRPSAIPRPARMPSDALGGFVDALEQPICVEVLCSVRDVDSTIRNLASNERVQFRGVV
jgi:hypothetical protein